MIQAKQITYSVPGEWAGVAYASRCPFSPDNREALIILVNHYGHAVDGKLAGDYIGIGASDEPMWLPNKNTFVYIKGNRIVRWPGGETIRQFFEYPEYVGDQQNGICATGEGDINANGCVALATGDRKKIFVYDIAKDSKGTVVELVHACDGLKVGPSNQMIVSSANGIWLVQPGSQARELWHQNAHCCVTRDAAGDDVLVYAESDSKNQIVKVRLADGERTELLDLGWANSGAQNSMAVNLSGCDKPWVAASLYGVDPSVRFSNQILKLPLDGSAPEVLCDHGSRLPTVGGTYNWHPKAALSRDGSRFVFNSNSGKTTIPDHCDVWLGMLTEAAVVAPVAVTPATHARIDYSGFVGKSEFKMQFRDGLILTPRTDGGCDISGVVDVIERKI